MIIKKNKGRSKYVLSSLVAIIITLVITSLFVNQRITTSNKNKKRIAKDSDEIQLNTPTLIKNSATIQKIVEEDIGLLKKDSVCSIYITNFLGTPNLTYVYKGKLDGRELTDRIFVHLFLKDKSKLPPEQRYINIGADFVPKSFQIDKESYFYSNVRLVDKFLDIDNVDFINTGRYLPSVSRSYGASKLKLDVKGLPRITNSFKSIVINLKEKAYEKIARKREEAIKSNVLITNDDDFVSAEIFSLNDTIVKNVDLRLKGDWVDHLRDEKKWSFRIKMQGENTFFRMRKFSIQHPKTRNFIWEWLFNKVVKENGLIGLRYDFLNTVIKVESKESIRNIDLGVMALEESFDKILIENNKRREGIILSFNESYMWSDRNKAYRLNLPNSAWEREVDDPKIRVFNQNKVLSTPKLLKQFNTAKGLMNELKKGSLKISEVFDIDKLTFFVALSNLFGGHHGLVWHNIRFYYNPITNRLEPISFDSGSGMKINGIKNYVFTDTDSIYQQRLYENLKLVSSQKFVQGLIDKYENGLIENSLGLGTEFNFNFDASILEHNSNFIKKQLSPSTALITSLKNFDESEMTLEIKNLSKLFPVIVKGLIKKGDKVLSEKVSTSLIKPNETREVTIKLKESFMNAFVSKKNKKGYFRFPKDLEKIKVVYHISESNYERFGDIVPYNEDDANFLKRYENSNNVAYHKFVLKNELAKTILLKKGEYTIKNDVIIPSGYTVNVEPGFNLNLIDGASFISYSAINCKGTVQSPIRFYSSNSSGEGVFVSGAKEESYLEHCYFSNLANPSNELWELSGAVNFHETTVKITSCIFEDNRCEDGLNIIRSTFLVDSSEFKNTYSDAFDGDFVRGSIKNCKFLNSGNDGIDVSGSEIIIVNSTIENSSDKAISGGEASYIRGKKINIIGGEIGIVSKDLSKIILDSINIIDARLGFAAFQKKSEFGPGSIVVTNLELKEKELDYLVENNSILNLNNKWASTVSNSVIDKMYGKEYGKSTR